MASLQSTSSWKRPRSKRSLALTGLLAVLAIGALWYVTEGFSDGTLASLTLLDLVASVFAGAVLGILDLYTLVDERLRQLQPGSVLTRVVVGGLLGVTGAVLSDVFDLSPVLSLIVLVSLLVTEFAARAYYVFTE